MTKMSEIAIRECVEELRAGSRRPIDASAVDTVVAWLRPEFERILDRADGGRRWADHGARVRETSRHMGTLADFFGHHADTAEVGTEQLTQAVKMIRADCTLRAERTPMAFKYCPKAEVDSRAAEIFLREIAPVPHLVRRAG